MTWGAKRSDRSCGAQGFRRNGDAVPVILETHGIPMAIYHDQHSSLVRTDGHWSLQEQMQGRHFPTHVGRVLEELGIESIPATSPQAKGRIEKTFATLQDRLMPELRLANIASIPTANAWLQAEFIPR